jgi:hypothetical protein
MWMSRSPSLSKSNIFVPEPRQEGGAHADICRNILERPVAAILIQGVELFREVRNKNVWIPVPVVIGAVDAHPRLRLAVRIESYSGSVGDIGERAVTVVSIQKFRTVSFAT